LDFIADIADLADRYMLELSGIAFYELSAQITHINQ